MNGQGIVRRAPLAFAIGIWSVSALANSHFSEQESQNIREFWEAPGRYRVGLPHQWETRGVWQVRLTVDGSKWLHTVARNGSSKKPIPGQTARPETPEKAHCEAWIKSKLAYDRWQAADRAYQLNVALIPGVRGPQGPCPPAPGDAPETLTQLAGPAPKLAEAVVPLKHSILWEPKLQADFHDHAEVSERYPFYRFDEGVMLAGKALRKYEEAQLNGLYLEAEISPFERKVMEAVSGLEGGFEAVNTYDTGFVSVGFIQFASLRDGAGSLGKLLRNYKSDAPSGFESDFRRFGIDVTPDGKLVALDLDLYVQQVGADANTAIIQDKRLIAIFHRAGLVSQGFRVAQLRTAKSEYYPGARPLEISINGQSLKFKVADIIKSEAGMATLMDRLVNTGTLDPLPMTLVTIAATHNLRTVEDLAKRELDVVNAMRYRKDYLKEKDLTKPDAGVNPTPKPQP